MNLTDLHTFSLVAETGTISGAAKRLGVPKSTVSRRVQRLEDALGHELLRRAPRSVTLTEHGKVLFQRSAPSLKELHAAAATLAHADTEPQGTLRITTVPGFGQSHQFIRCIRDYGLKYPKTTVELELTPRVVNLVEEGFDVGVRLHGTALPGNPNLMSRRLCRFGRAMYGSADYVAKMGTPSTLEDLHKHRIAAHSIVDVRGIPWTIDGEPVKTAIDLPSPRWLINDSAALEQFALSGAGLALISTAQGDRWAEKGELVRILPQVELRDATASLVWPESRHLSPRIRAFIDHAVATMGDSPVK